MPFKKIVVVIGCALFIMSAPTLSTRSTCPCGAKLVGAPTRDLHRERLCICELMASHNEKLAINKFFILAVLRNKIKTVAFFLERKIIQTPRTKDKIPNFYYPIQTLQQAFFHAALNGHLEIVYLLLDNEYVRLSCLKPWLIDLAASEANKNEHEEVCQIIVENCPLETVNTVYVGPYFPSSL
ncbi:MAG: hypothetical protein WCT20_00810 [Candidatus Babeliales bacterium]|jgi:hypothetical protein